MMVRHNACNPMDVIQALTSRKSIRAYLPDPVPVEEIDAVLAAARRSPSGTNTQPWKVHVVRGESRVRLCKAVLEQRAATPEREKNDQPFGEYLYYSIPMTEPYLSRRRKVGWDMYRLLGVEKGDYDASRQIAARNFTFFDAPVGLIFTLEKVLEKGSWIDLGIYLQSVMMAAHAMGLGTCPQGAWAFYYDVIRAQLDIPDSDIVVCGMALGYPDSDAVVNTLITERADAETLVTYHN